jgi:hypothetical protein
VEVEEVVDLVLQRLQLIAEELPPAARVQENSDTGL